MHDIWSMFESKVDNFGVVVTVDVKREVRDRVITYQA